MPEKSLKQLIQEQFESDSLQLPVFNRVALELQQLKGSETASLDRIAAVIMKDQSLASRILRIANSSFYGGLKQVDTVSRAVVRLGMERVSNLAMVASQLLAHNSRVQVVGDYMNGLWARSFAASVGARWVALETGRRSRAEEAFLAGLLHDIGELFLLKVLEKLALDREQPLQLSEPLLLEVLEALHNEMGCELMRKWGLPEPYALVARDHHLETIEGADELLLIVRLLDVACQKLGIGQPPAGDIVLAAVPEAQELGIKEIKLAELEVMLEDAMAEAGAMLGE